MKPEITYFKIKNSIFLEISSFQNRVYWKDNQGGGGAISISEETIKLDINFTI